MEKFEEIRKGMLTTGEWCVPVSKISHHKKIRDLSGEGIGNERFEINGSVLTGILRSLQHQTVEVPQEAGVVPRSRYTLCHRDLSLLVAVYDT